MTLKRRDALALAVGVALAGAERERIGVQPAAAGAVQGERCRQRRMAAKLDALQLYWNEGAIADFLREHCTEHVQINMFLDGRGGNWSEALPALDMFRDRYKRINSVFPDRMFDPTRPYLYAFVELEPPPVPPPGPDDEIILCSGGPVSTFAVSMRFDMMEQGRKSLLGAGDRILSGIGFRENGQMSNWFESSRV